VTDKFQGLRIIAGDNLDLRIVFYRVAKIAQCVIDDNRHSLLGQRFRNSLRDLNTGHAVIEFARIAIGEGKGNHFSLLSLTAHQAGKMDLAPLRGHKLPLRNARV